MEMDDYQPSQTQTPKESADKIDRTLTFVEIPGLIPGTLPDECPQPIETVTLAQALEYIRADDIELGCDGERLLLKQSPVKNSPQWIAQIIINHESNLLSIVKARTLFKLIDDRITRLRYENPPNGRRDSAFAWLKGKMIEFKRQCDLPDGYHDPSDPFADSALSTLQFEYDELTAEGNPYPIPKDDPGPRFPNGKLEQTHA